jgi:heparan-alpha-glucosaminide N-acetyltransferase
MMFMHLFDFVLVFDRVVAFVITTIYLSLLYGLYVPDWEYQILKEDQGSTLTTFLNLKVKCGVRGHTGPGCNAVGMLDRMFLGIQHLYRKPVYARTKYKLSKQWAITSRRSFLVSSAF